MKFPWHKYDEIPSTRRNTAQIFITNRCNLNCNGCFVKKVMEYSKHTMKLSSDWDMSIDEYQNIVNNALKHGCKQINILGGEPLMHPNLPSILNFNNHFGIKTTVYTNGYFLNNFPAHVFENTKIRISLYCKNGKLKSLDTTPEINYKYDTCFMVSKDTTVQELLETAYELEFVRKCDDFFISSIRELDNPNQEFFDDTDLTMPVLEYKKLVHEFLTQYIGNMRIHVSKRGVFESTLGCGYNTCMFINYFTGMGNKVIQCPYDIVNLKFQDDYEFGARHCQHNNTCMMTKVIYQRIMGRIL